ncbi:MAG: hypothetical protein ACI4SX_08505 [Candidatus Fimenecus sp.]
MKRKALRFISNLLLLSIFLNFVVPYIFSDETETADQSSIINGSFEYPNLKDADTKNTGWANIVFDDTAYDAKQLSWKTTATDKKIEYAWLRNTTVVSDMSPHMKPTVVQEIVGNGPSDGLQFAELVANEVSSLYQSLTVKSGEDYSWTIHHRGRSGVDTLAFIITNEDNSLNYVKPDKNQSDRFQQILTWMKSTGVTAPSKGNMAEYTIYTTKLKDPNSFDSASSGSFFSFTQDGEHIVKFNIYLMSTAKEDWGEYKGSYYSDSNKNIMFVLTPFSSSFKNSSGKDDSSGGNLLDNMSFTDKKGNNLLINASFEDVAITGAYSSLSAANAPTPSDGIGWCTTASDYKVEVSNIKYGDVYKLGASVQNVVKNEPTVRNGKQFAELNANEESSLYQIVNTEPGKMYRWKLSHRGRSGKDTMALIIGPNQPYDPKKTSATARDQLMQMVDWLYSQTDVALDIPAMGCSDEIKLYTSKFNNNGGFQNSGDSIRWQSDENHTEEWSIWIISSENDDWHDYGDFETGATYNYNYIVPKGQDKTVFGFVSVNAVDDSGKDNKTYGNLLDNIEFKELYYIHAAFDKDPDKFGYVYIKDESGKFEYDEDTGQYTGWALAGSNISIHYQEATRPFIGGYINGVFVPADQWTKIEVDGKTEYYYDFENVNSSITVNIVYQAQNVIYDSRNQHPYQYDLNDENSGYEVPMSKYPNGYESHAPQADEGWKFMGWQYILTIESNIKTFMLDAVHKVEYYEENTSNYLKISNFSPDGTTQTVIDKIHEDEGITLFAQWKYRQRVIAKTFDKILSTYEPSTEGGTVEVKLLYTDDDNPESATDYNPYGENVPIGQELYASAGDTYIGVTAKNKTGYIFSGWHDEDGNLITRNPSYSYKVKDGDVTQLYAYFEPNGYNVTINTNVIGNTEEENKYFAINCNLSNLRENNIYAVSGLPNNINIMVNGEAVVNPTNIKADENGVAAITLYMKLGDSATLLHLPAGTVYSVIANNETKSGFSVRGEVTADKLTVQNKVVDLLFYKVDQFISFDFGKHYEGILSKQSPIEITITEKSSYTLDVETEYTPSIYTELNIFLCFYAYDGTQKNFFMGTRILMIDLSNQNEPKYYSYTVNNSVSSINLTQFTELGSANTHFAPKTGEMLTEKLVFIVDYVGTNNANSGKISLVYNDNNDELKNIFAQPQKAVNIGTDTTELIAVGNGNTSSNEQFVINVTIGESAPAVNTTYKGSESSKYAVKISVDGGNLPDGSYAIVDGKTYYGNNGYINISPLAPGSFNVIIYPPVPLQLSDSKVKFTTTLLSAVSTSATVPVEIIKTPIEYSCFDVAINAELSNKVLSPGNVSSANIILKHKNLDEVKLTVSQKNSDGTYTEILTNVNVNLPDDDAEFTVNLSNGFNSESGKTYIFSFIGYVSGLPVCIDNCCAAGGYLLNNY